MSLDRAAAGATALPPNPPPHRPPRCQTGLPGPRPTRYTVAVRTLCEFAARQGDLDHRFTPSPSALQGVQGHRTVAASRSPDYRAELSLSGEFKTLLVRGRADGYDAGRQRLEEVKTCKGDPGRLPAPQRALHWAQAKVYGWLLCRQLGLPALNVSLVYFDIVRQQEAPPLVQHCSAADLQRDFEALCERFIGWADSELAHRAQRDADLSALRFPHADFRGGQRLLAEAVFNAARSGRCLLAQAPTGIGKTIGTLFPLLKACPGQGIDKLFFLTAKGTGRVQALRAVEAMQGAEPGLALRVIDLPSREKACEHPDKACHGESCRLARGFHDRLPAARAAAMVAAAAGPLDREVQRRVALAHDVCPYHLGQELVRWCDVVIGDYNHYFDSAALLHGLTLANGWRVAVLVDEAHNLLERARAMYSATLTPAGLRAALVAAPPALKAPLEQLRRAWLPLGGAMTAPYETHDEPPRRFVAALHDATVALSAHLTEGLPDTTDVSAPDLQRWAFDALRFRRRLDTFGPHSIFDLTADGGSATLCLRNVVPAPFLRPRLAAAHTTVLFSATLAPRQFHADLLGLPPDTRWLDVPTPFSADQLRVHVVHHVSTRWAQRGGSLAPIARLIAAQYAARPGNYLAFFSSFDYLQQAARVFQAHHPQIAVWVQGRHSTEAERAAFLARFSEDGRGVGFAVLGGAFAEGIDLAGTRLIGAFIATLGLPQFNPVNEALRRRLDAEFGAGHDYAYLFPGLRKVVQAAGRVIRTPADRGCLHLIDDRYARADVQRLLPAWWRLEAAATGDDVADNTPPWPSPSPA